MGKLPKRHQPQRHGRDLFAAGLINEEHAAFISRGGKNDLNVFNQKTTVTFVETHVQERLKFCCRLVGLRERLSTVAANAEKEKSEADENKDRLLEFEDLICPLNK